MRGRWLDRKQFIDNLDDKYTSSDINTVSRIATHDPYHLNRVRAMDYLERSKHETGFATLHYLAKHDMERRIREVAMRDLARWGNEPCLDRVVHVVMEDSNWQVRKTGVEILGALKHSQCSLERIAANDEHYLVRKAAQQWLSKHERMNQQRDEHTTEMVSLTYKYGSDVSPLYIN